MIESWRELLYPLGFLSTFAFCGRFLLQWIHSEIKRESVVTVNFWRLSLVGNLLLLLHSFIQAQLHVGLIQTCNAIISWCNMNLMGAREKQITTKQTLLLLTGALILSLGLFILQGIFLMNHAFDLFRVPITLWHLHADLHVTWPWHVLGLAGLLLFNARFWVQWWGVEQKQTSYIGPSFWWISLMGDLLCLSYFARLNDPVNLIGPVFGLIPYIRNLMLLRKTALNQS